MPQPTADLDAIVISSPCTVPWESMTGDEARRFCGQCRLHVHDTSQMSRRRVRALLTNTNGECCLRVWRRPDGRVITKDCRRVVRALARRLAFVRTAAAALFAFVGLGGCGTQESHETDATTGVVAPRKPAQPAAAKPVAPSEPPVEGATVITGR